MRKKFSVLFTGIFMLCGLILAAGMETKAADNWSAFEVTVTTSDNLAPGTQVTFQVTIKNTTENNLTTSWINHFYYNDATTDNSETTDPDSGCSFGILKEGDVVISDGTENIGSGITFAPGQARTFTLSGTIPPGWMEKSEVLIVVGAQESDCYGQGGYPIIEFPDEPGADIDEEYLGNAVGNINVAGNDWDKSVFTEDEINSGTDRRVTFIADKVSVENLTPNELAEVRAKAEGKLIAAVFDMGIYKSVGNAGSVEVTQLNAPILITVNVPEEYRAANRKFSIIRLHDGMATVLEDLDSNPNTVTISTDQFSYYTLVYADTVGETVTDPSQETDNGEKKPDVVQGSSSQAVPEIRKAAAQTGDMSHISMYILTSFVSVFVISYIVKRQKTLR